MPFKGFNKCGRCRKNGRDSRNNLNLNGVYCRSELEIEIVEVGEFKEKRLKVTCPFGHTWLSKSRSANRYIRDKESKLPKEV